MKTLLNSVSKSNSMIKKEIKKGSNNILIENYHLVKKVYNAVKNHSKNSTYLSSYPNNGKMTEICMSLLTEGVLKSEKEIIRILQSQNLKLNEISNICFFLTCSIIILLSENTANKKLTDELIKSLRLKDDLDYENIINESSITEKILLSDPACIYPYMSKNTKLQYRKAVKEISIKTNKKEEDVAKELIEKAESCADKSKNHIGFYLDSLTDTKTKNGYIILIAEIVFPILISLCFSILFSKAYIFFLTLFPMYEIVKTLISHFEISFKKAKPLLKMEQSFLSEDQKCAIVVSTLLFPGDNYEELKKKLVNLYRTSVTSNTYIVLLADLKTGKNETEDTDKQVLQKAKNLCDELNEKYNDRFIFIVRNRVYCKTQKEYIGYERKRGAIIDFCNLVKEGKSVNGKVFGNIQILKNTNYIMALDSDSVMPLEQLTALLCTAAHPLNKPVFSNNKNKVVEGYGIIMPKTETLLQSAHSSYFSHFSAGHGGLNGYNTLTAEKYQNILEKTLFTGKGLIHIDTFTKTMTGRFEEERILSHDCLEGIIMRTGFAGDVTILDSFPVSPISFLARQHRWIRGDWQNFLYVLKNRSNNFTFSDYFWIFDNITRSLTPTFILLSILLSFFFDDKTQTFLIIISLFGLCSGDIYSFLTSLIKGGTRLVSRLYYSDTIPTALQCLIRALITTALLPAQAISNLDAIVRTLYRWFISKSKLLEWTTASQSDKNKKMMKPIIYSVISSLLGWLMLAYFSNTGKIAGIIFILSITVFFLSTKKPKERKNRLKKQQRAQIKSYALDIWKFFDNYVTKQDNYLPVDNVQFFPVYTIAHRTSPTNIGLYLVSLLGARDLNFISTDELYHRAKKTLTTLKKIKKYKGHLYNWYDTQTLDVLDPEYISTVDSGNFIVSLVTLKQGLKDYVKENEYLWDLIYICEDLILNTDFHFLYNDRRAIFHIGFNPKTNEKSNSYYDLLMSEARITSYYTVASKQVPAKHLSSLGRALAIEGRHTSPISWSGTMFEYYMPALFIPVYKDSIYEESLKFCLEAQKKFAAKRRIPWGVSESCFFSFDSSLNYQYKANSVPSLALCRTNKKEAVISPYSSFLALITDIYSPLKNLKAIHSLGAYGKYGFYEAIDYTKSRTNGQAYAIIKNYMSHHLGMSFISCVNALSSNIFPKRFTSDEYSAAGLNLLEEKVPIDTKVSKAEDNNEKINIHERVKRSDFIKQRTDILSPGCNLMTNNELSLISSGNGENGLIYKGISLLKKPTGDILSPCGVFACLKTDNVLAPFSFAPYFRLGESFSSEYSSSEITQKANYSTIKLTQKIKLHPQKSAVIIKYIINTKNKNVKSSTFMLYFEPYLTDINITDNHPAFSKLFIVEEYNPDSGVIIFTKQKRDNERTFYIACGFKEKTEFTPCFNREIVLKHPHGYFSLFRQSVLSNQQSADKCCYIEVQIDTNKKSPYQFDFIISAGDTKEDALNILMEIRNEKALSTQNLVPYSMDSLTGIFTEEVIKNIFFSSNKQTSSEYIEKNTLDLTALWRYGISGDVPIIVTQGITDKQSVIPFIKMHQILALSGIKTETVIIIHEDELYYNKKTEMVKSAMSSLSCDNLLNQRNGIFLLNETTADENILTLIKSTACFVYPYKKTELLPCTNIKLIKNSTLAYNKKSGFTNNGFLINSLPPLPWCTVLANPSFGTLVSESSLGYTWAINSAENRLTHWSNDSATDNYSEKLFMEFEGSLTDIIKGSSAFFTKDIAVYMSIVNCFNVKTTVTVPKKGMKKEITIVVTNNSSEEKAFNLEYYCEILMAEKKGKSDLVKSEICENTVLFTNPANSHFNGYTAISTDIKNIEIDYGEKSYMLSNINSSKNCCSVKGRLILPPKKSEIYKYVLSYGKTKDSAIRVAKLKLKDEQKENKLTINSENEKLDILFNVFLPTQILNSRIYGRTGFYQSSGAYGFRDQLQDVISLIPIKPDIAKQQIYRCANAQFIEGDVFHWFHIFPYKQGQKILGARTRCSDDLLFLPYAVAEYCTKTGDYSILKRKISYLKGEQLRENENEKCFQTEKSQIKESLYLHCIRAIEKSMDMGEHGLPLIKNGDWNDSFNAVGIKGKGESVWLAMFMKLVLDSFIPIVQMLEDAQRLERYKTVIENLTISIQTHAWDNDRYIRAFYDDGEVMGSEKSKECKIDLLPQSFSVISNLQNKERQTTALKSALKNLVDYENQVIRLFTPGFTPISKKAGYVNAYPTGIRENAGQYTHSAIWLCSALFKNGNIEDAYKLLKMILPYNRPTTQYKTEPYYTSADVYYRKNMMGRGGWSLYTGSAGWLYRTIYEDMFGLKFKEGKPQIKPNLPIELMDSTISYNDQIIN